MRAWERFHRSDCTNFWEELAESNFDYIVPVARKACKLMSASEDVLGSFRDRIYYKDYFDITSTPVEGKSVAIVDDSVQYGTGLAEYRKFFEKKKAKVSTLAFVGHERLLKKDNNSYDPEMKVRKYLSSEVYRQYLLQQSLFLIARTAHQDIDHVVLQISISGIEQKVVSSLEELLPTWGYSYGLYPLPGVERFSLDHPTFFNLQSIDTYIPSITSDFVEKIRFAFSETGNILNVLPMVFPKMIDHGPCPWNISPRVLELPCQHFSQDHNHAIDRLCYISSHIYLSVLLGREFLLNLGKVNQSLYSIMTKSLQVRNEDFIRYFGKDYGRKLALEIREFLLGESDDNTLLPLIRKSRPQRTTTPPVLSNEFVSVMLNTLRRGYEKECRERRTRYRVHYTLTTEELLKLIPSIHPFALSEAIDENCDLGYLVPCTERRNGSWRRAYRTGEPKPAALSVALIAFAISIMGTEEGVLYKSSPETVIKLLANYCYDFPSEWADKEGDDYRDCHTLISKPSHWGTEISFLDTDTKRRISLYNPESFTTQLAKHWVLLDRGGRIHFVTNRTVITDIMKTLDELKSQSLFVNSYFKLMKAFKEGTGTDESLNALSLCRDEEWFMMHIIHNLNNWLEYYGRFLGKLQSSIRNRTQYAESAQSGPLHQAAREAKSASDKTKYPNKLKTEWMPKLCEIAGEDQAEFRVVIRKIKSETLEILPESSGIARIFNVVDAVSGITDLALVKMGFKRKPDDRLYEVALKAFKGMGYDINVDHFLQSPDKKNIFNKLMDFFKQAGNTIKILPGHLDSKLARRNAYYAKRDHNFIASKIREGIEANRWNRISFLAIDLSKSTSPSRDGRILSIVRGKYTEVVKEYLAELNGIYKDPEGDDCFMVLCGGDDLRSLECARKIQEHFKKRCSYGKDDPSTIRAKYGLSMVQGIEYIQDLQRQNTAMGIAKDCCEIKRGFMNEKDVICTEDFKVASTLLCEKKNWVWRKLPKESKISRGGQVRSLYRLSNKRKNIQKTKKSSEGEYTTLLLDF